MSKSWEDKTTKAERGVAHIIRRPLGNVRKPPPQRPPEVPTVQAPPLDDSGEVLVTPVKRPAMQAPAGKDRGGDATGTLDELTVEDAARPLPPLSLVRGAAARAAANPSAGVAQLVITKGNDRGRSHPLVGSSISVGRGVDNDVVLTDISVSRHHLVIELDGLAYWVRDLGSGNGTLLNDREHEGRTRLCHGDRLELGNTEMRFDASDAVDSAVSTGNWDPRGDDEPATIEGRRGDRGHKATRDIGPPVPARRRPGPSSRQPPLPPPAALEPPRAGARERAAAAAMAAVHSADPLSAPSFPPPGHGAPLPGVPSAAAPMSGPGAPFAGPGAPMPGPGAPMPGPGAPLPGMPASGPVPGAPLPGPPPVQYPTLPAQLPPLYPTPSYGPGQPPSGSLPSLPAAPPRAAARDRHKLLIGAISVALVLVCIGIVAVLKTGGGDGKAAAAEPPASQADGVAAAPSGAGAEPQARPMATLAALRTGKRELPASAWGTDESFVAELPEPAGEAEADTEAAPEPASDDDGQAAERERQQAAERERQQAAERERQQAAERERQQAAERERQQAAERERRQAAERERRDRPRQRQVQPAVDTRAVKAQALTLYKQQRFTDAADALRDAAGDLDGRDASELRKLAAGYGQVGNLLASAERSQRSDAPAALRAYKRALQRDEQVTGGVHSTLIRLRIGQVAPRAARAYMTKKRYADAKRAADDAARFGAADDVAAVVGSLERRAERDLDEALGLLDDGDEDGARELLEDIRAYAPSRSSVRDRVERELRQL